MARGVPGSCGQSVMDAQDRRLGPESVTVLLLDSAVCRVWERGGRAALAVKISPSAQVSIAVGFIHFDRRTA